MLPSRGLEFRVHFEQFWTSGNYVDPARNEQATFRTVLYQHPATSASEEVVEVLDTDGGSLARVFRKRPTWLRNDPQAKRFHSAFAIEGPEDDHYGLIWPATTVIDGRWLIHLDTNDEQHRLRARNISADWNSDHSCKELHFELDGESSKSRAEVVARWTGNNDPTYDITIALDPDLPFALRALLLVTPLCLPLMGLTGAAYVRTQGAGSAG